MKLTDKNGKEYEFEKSSINSSALLGLLKPIKPEPKKIDMSVCIESQIDCEFSDDVFNYAPVRKLKQIDCNGKYISSNINNWKYCRPRFKHIHASPAGWGKKPFPEGFNFRAWHSLSEAAIVDTWSECGNRTITMFEITGIAEGYEL